MHARRLGTLACWAGAAVMGCGGDEAGPVASVDDVAGAAPAYTDPGTDPCARAVGTPAQANRSSAVQLAEAHATHRLFGHIGAYSEADSALAEAIGNGNDWQVPQTLRAYGTALQDVCVLDAAVAELGPLEARLADGVLHVKPGTGELQPSDEFHRVVVDLRDLPEVAELEPALETAVAVALAEALPRPRRDVRRHDGYPDGVYFELVDLGVSREEYDMNAPYRSSVDELRPGSIPGGGTERELVLLTGPRLSPTAAELAGTLRLARKAWIVGHDVLSAVAESTVQTVGAQGVLTRVEDLFLWDNEGRWPERIAADLYADDPMAALPNLDTGAAPASVPLSAAQRPVFDVVDRFDDVQSDMRSPGQVRAALLTAHGVLRRMFPYFHLVGDDFDARLDEVLASLGPETDAGTTVPALSRLLHALQDGHAWAMDMTADPTAQREASRRTPFVLDVLEDGSAVVSTSATEQLVAGERIVEKDGVALEDHLDAILPLISSSTDAQRSLLAYERFTVASGDQVSLTVEGLDGARRNVVVDSLSSEAFTQLAARRWARRSGWLAEEGAADVYYINLDGTSREVFEPETSMAAQLDEAIAQNARALVLDMRNYPGQGAFELLTRLREEPMDSQQFWVSSWIGPDVQQSEMSQWNTWSFLPATTYDGPIMLLIGPGAQSASETVAGLLVGNDRVTAVGRPTGGTNGNITGVELPGRFGVTWTGMEVRNVDGSDFHGIGVLPHVPVLRTQALVASGEDPDIQAALQAL